MHALATTMDDPPIRLHQFRRCPCEQQSDKCTTINYLMSSYHRVPAAESEDSSTATSSTAAAGAAASVSSSRRRGSWTERFQNKLLAFLWVLLAAMVAYFSNFWTVITLQQPLSSGESAPPPPTASRPIMQVAALCLGANVLLAAYLLLYLPYVKGLTDSSAWDVYCPRVVPSMSVLGVLSLVLLIRGTWPVWGCLAPLVVGVEILGSLFATQFVPWPCQR